MSSRNNLKNRIGGIYEGLNVQTLFSKTRKTEKRPKAIKPIELDQKNPVEDSDLDKISMFSKKSYVQKKIQEFLNTMYSKELNSKDGLQHVLTQVLNLERKIGKELPPGKQ